MTALVVAWRSGVLDGRGRYTGGHPQPVDNLRVATPVAWTETTVARLRGLILRCTRIRYSSERVRCRHNPARQSDCPGWPQRRAATPPAEISLLARASDYYREQCKPDATFSHPMRAWRSPVAVGRSLPLMLQSQANRPSLAVYLF